jgi:hypothetical protein
MIPAGLKAGSMALRFLRTLYGAKAKVGKASKAASSFAGKKGFTKTSQFITGASQKTHKGTKLAKRYIKKYPKSAAALGGAVGWDIIDSD